VNVDRHLLTDEGRGDRVTLLEHADEAAAADAHPVLDAVGQRRGLKRFHHRYFLYQPLLTLLVPFVHHPEQKLLIALEVGKIPAAAQQQFLLQRSLQSAIS